MGQARLSEPRYVYVGRTEHRGRLADPVLRPDGKCIVGRGGGPHNQLIRWADDGTLCVVPARTLRLYAKRKPVQPVNEEDLHGRIGNL